MQTPLARLGRNSAKYVVLKQGMAFLIPIESVPTELYWAGWEVRLWAFLHSLYHCILYKLLAALIAYLCWGMCVWCGILAQKGQLLHEPVQMFALECLSSCQRKSHEPWNTKPVLLPTIPLRKPSTCRSLFITCFVYGYLYCLTVLFNTLNYEFPTANNIYLPLLKPCMLYQFSFSGTLYPPKLRTLSILLLRLFLSFIFWEFLCISSWHWGLIVPYLLDIFTLKRNTALPL